MAVPPAESPGDPQATDIQKRLLYQQAFWLSREMIEAFTKDRIHATSEPMEIWLRLRSHDDRRTIEQVAPGFMVAFEEMVELVALRFELSQAVPTGRLEAAVQAMTSARNKMLKLPMDVLVGRQRLVTSAHTGNLPRGRWADKAYDSR